MHPFIDLHQYRRIAESQREAVSARQKADQFDGRLSEIERRTNRLALACQALWELLSEQTGMTEEMVLRKMEEIDLRDGRLDGKIGGQVLNCMTCGRTINTSRPICIYCGHRNPVGHIVQ